MHRRNSILLMQAGILCVVSASIVGPLSFELPDDVNHARWYADFQLQVNLTEIVQLVDMDASGSSYPSPLIVDMIGREILGAGKSEILLINAAEFQEDVRSYWQGVSARPPLGMALFLASAPYVFQQQVLQECPMVLAASYVLLAEVFLYVEPNMGYAVDKYEVGKALSEQNKFDTDAWGLSLGLKKFEAAVRLKRKKIILDVVIVQCKETMDWFHEQFQPFYENDWEFVDKVRLFMYNKCGEQKREEQKVRNKAYQGINRLQMHSC